VSCADFCDNHDARRCCTRVRARWKSSTAIVDIDRATFYRRYPTTTPVTDTTTAAANTAAATTPTTTSPPPPLPLSLPLPPPHGRKKRAITRPSSRT